MKNLTQKVSAICFRWLITLVFVAVCGFNSNAANEYSLTATGGTLSATYSTLGAAFTAINAGTHTGTITISITANPATTEGATPATLNSSGAGSANYASVTIFPAVDGVTISGAPASGFGVIQLNGADNVIIDGDNPNTSGTNRNLTLTNTAAAATTYTSVYRIALSTLITSANSNTIKNCIINGSATGQNNSGQTSTTAAVHTTHGILVGGGASTVAVTTAPSAITSISTTIGSGITATSFTADNNQIDACARGIQVNGSATTVANLLTVTNNIVGNATPGNTTTVYSRAIALSGFDNCSISGNTVRNIESFLGTQINAIYMGEASTSGTNAIVEKNTISRVFNRSTGTFGAHGITANAGANITIRNNTVCEITHDMTGGVAFSSANAVSGIRLLSGTNGKVYHNSVNLFGTLSGTANSSHASAALYINSTSLTGWDIRNNIFSNTISGGTTSVAHVSILVVSGGTSAMNLTLNNNAYYCASGANQFMAHVGTSFTTTYTAANFNPAATSPATNFRAYSSTLSAAGTNDNASIGSTNAAPFTSNSNLHLNMASSQLTDVEQKGATGTGVTTDFDGDTRPNSGTTLPDMGFDEVAIPGCTVADGGTITPTSANLCSPATYTMTTTGATTGTGITYQWQVATVSGGPYSNVTGGSGATTTSYTTATLLPGTYYYILLTTCANCGPCSDPSNQLTLTVNPSQAASVTPATATLCSGSSQQLTTNCESYTVSGTLSGAQEVPPNGSGGTGTVSGVYNAVTNALVMRVDFSNLNGTVTAAHIHGPAPAGSNAGVLIDLVTGIGLPTGGTSGTATGTVTIAAANEADLFNGLLYVNIHTSAFGGGEVRAQLSAVCNAPTSYAWLPVTGLSNTAISNPVASPTATTTYTVTVTGTGGCTATATSAITVIPVPVTTGGSACVGGTGSVSTSSSCTIFTNAGTSISGTWTAGTDPTANRPATSMSNAAICSFVSPAVARNYVTQQFQVSVTGNYIFEMNDNAAYDGMGYIVTGSFVPGNCGGGGTWVRGDDDNGVIGNEPRMGDVGIGSGVMTLTAGVTYTLISTNYSATAGSISGSFAWTITPPSGGQIMLPATGTMQWWDAASGGNIVGTGSSYSPPTTFPGTYTFYAACSNNNTCRTAAIFVVNSPPTVSVTGTTDASCYGVADGEIDVTISGGTAPYSSTWTGPSFGVTVDNKNSSHPYFGSGSGFGFVIDGVQGRELTLVRGVTYSFNINNPGHPMYISTDVDGAGLGEVTDGVTGSQTDFGTLTFTPNANHPNLLYYQCFNHQNMGWQINIVDPPSPTAYSVISAAKTAAHPYFGVGSANGYKINGVEGPAFTMIRGTTYTFNINAPGHPFYISTSSVGAGAGEVLNGVTGSQTTFGTLTFTPNATHPALLYYQCYAHPNMGWKINIVDPPAATTQSVIVVTKTAAHPYFGTGSALGYELNGTEGPELTLMRGTTYTFNINAPGHPFYISTDAAGAGVGEVTNGVTGSQTSFGTLTFTPNASHPSLLYYQCFNHLNMGYKLNIINPPLIEDLDNLHAGLYTITVTDANGCTGTINATISEPAATLFYADVDGDTYGDENITAPGCTAPNGFVSISGDCNDNDPLINPGALEICGNAVDENCDGLTETVAPSTPSSISGAPSSVCPPQTGIVLSVTNDPNTTSYLWIGSNGVSFNPPSTTNTQTVDLGTTTNSTYTIKVSASNSCGTSAYSTVGIRRSVATPGPISGPATICPGSTQTYSVAPVTGATSYIWTGPAGTLFDGTNPTPYTVASNSVSATMPSGFVSGIISVSAQVACYTSPAKSMSISTSGAALGSMSGTSFVVCPNSSYTFSVPSSSSIASYSWTLPSGASGSSTTNSILASWGSTVTAGNICVTGTSICGVATAPRCKTVTSGVPARPASISGPTNGLCGQTVIYTTPAIGGVSYNWTLPPGATGSSTTNSISVTMPASLGTVSLCVNSVNACGSSLTRCITVKGAPNTPGAITPTPSTWCAPTSGIQFNGDISGLSGSYTLVWSWLPATNATYISGQGTSTLNVDWNTAGTTSVLLKATNSCGNATRTLNLNIAACRIAGSSNNNTAILSDVNIFPNPASNVLNIEFTSSANDNMSVKLLELSGREVMTRSSKAVSGFNMQTIDVSKLAKGIYLVSITTGGETLYSRIAVE